MPAVPDLDCFDELEKTFRTLSHKSGDAFQSEETDDSIEGLERRLHALRQPVNPFNRSTDFTYTTTRSEFRSEGERQGNQKRRNTNNRFNGHRNRGRSPNPRFYRSQSAERFSIDNETKPDDDDCWTYINESELMATSTNNDAYHPRQKVPKNNFNYPSVQRGARNNFVYRSQQARSLNNLNQGTDEHENERCEIITHRDVGNQSRSRNRRGRKNEDCVII